MNTPAENSTSTATRHYLVRAGATCLGVIAGFVLLDLLFFAQGASFKREGGGLENASAVLYLVAALVFLWQVPRSLHRRYFYIPALMMFFAAREADFDKAFTQSGIMSLRFYTGDSSLMVKLVGGFFALLAVYVLARVLWHGIPAAVRALRHDEIWPWFAIFAAGLVAVTKSIDGLGRKLLDFGIEISKDLDQTVALVEEVGEAFIPVCAILALLARWEGRTK